MARPVIDIKRRLEFWAGIKPHDVAFVDGLKEITFAELQINTFKIATTLREIGIQKDDLVCTMLPPFLDWPITLALQIIGAVSFAKPTNSNFDLAAQPRWLISTKEHPNFPTKDLVLVDDDFAEKVNSAIAIDEIEIKINPNKIYRLSSTSGTSGEAKYLAFSENEMLPLAENPSGIVFLGNGRFLNLFPLGASQSYKWALRSLMTGKTYFTSSPKSENLVGIILGKNVKTIIGSPSQISTFLTNLENRSIKLDASHNIIISGGAPSPKLLSRIRDQHQAGIYNSHGSAETGFISICDLTTTDSLGLLIHPNSIVEVLDENGQSSSPEEVGLLRYKIPHASTSYFNNPEATNEYFKDGFFYSGDLGYKTNAGQLFITGRSNEVINLGGEKVNPELVDRAAIEQNGILDAAAFALEDETGIPKLAIALVTDLDFNEDVFRDEMKIKFQGPKVEKIFQVRLIPRNPNGKVLRRELNLKFSSPGI
jgi:acyl-coenzyme A synthetase/AMP-(fatty) acid ligase